MDHFVEIFREFWQYFMQYFGDNWLIISFYLIAFVYLMIANQTFRAKIGYGMIASWFLLSFPPLYEVVWSRVFNHTFWRVFWLFHVELICACALVDLMRKIKQRWIQCGVLVISVLFFVIAGRGVYQNGVFVKAENPYKIKQPSYEIAQYLLSIDEKPFAICAMDVAVQIRQYSDDIQLLYARDAIGFSAPIFDENVLELRKQIDKSRKPDFAFITGLCRQYGVRYMIIKKKKNMDEIEPSGWRLISKIDKYYIYLLD